MAGIMKHYLGTISFGEHIENKGGRLNFVSSQEFPQVLTSHLGSSRWGTKWQAIIITRNLRARRCQGIDFEGDFFTLAKGQRCHTGNIKCHGERWQPRHQREQRSTRNLRHDCIVVFYHYRSSIVRRFTPNLESFWQKEDPGNDTREFFSTVFWSCIAAWRSHALLNVNLKFK